MAQLSKLPPSIQNDLNSMSVYARQSSHARAHVYATHKGFPQGMLLRVKELLQSARPELIGAVLGVILVFVVVGWYVIRAQAPVSLLSNASLETAGAGAGATSVRGHTSDSMHAKGAKDGSSSEASGLDESSDGAKDASGGAAAGSGSGSGSEDLIVVQVSGSVATPGVYELPLRARMQDAIAAAGGFAEDASADVLNLASALEDGQKIYVPKKGEAEAAYGISDQNDDAVGDEEASAGGSGAAGGSAGAAGGSGRSARSHAPSARSHKTSKSGSRSNKKSLPAHSVSLNRANAEELSSLPGIGEATAKRIIADRRAHGRFKKVEDLCRVKGIGKKKLASIKRYLRV